MGCLSPGAKTGMPLAQKSAAQDRLDVGASRHERGLFVIMDMEAIGAEAMTQRLRPLEQTLDSPTATNLSAELSTSSMAGSIRGEIVSKPIGSKTFFEDV